MGKGTFTIDIESNLLELMATKKRKINHKEVAKQLGIPIATYYRLKSGNGYKNFLKTLYDLCKYLECTPNDLLAEIDLENDKGVEI